jgi:hypothetical protein
MLPWAALLGTLGLNYARHRRGRSTLCSVTRRHVPVHEPEGRLVVVAAWAVLTGWLLPHLCAKRLEAPRS